ncbi:MAG: hypothetical protein JWN79_1724 [Gemmatimonadetes bacterium]|jgi:hypothetical protein|nr:hypothetical protein [Gemmatimonadota bacterium]
MRRQLLAAPALVVLAGLSACVPPREHVEGRSADGRMTVQLDLRPTSGDSVHGTGTLRVAGHPRTVVLRGRWNEKGDGLRRLAATLQSDTMPGEHWSLEWSPVSLDGTIRRDEGRDDRAAVVLTTLE